MNRWTNFLRGVVILRVRGPFPEGYLNRLGAAGVPFWDSQVISPEELRVSVARGSRRRALALGEEARCQVEAVEEWGLAALLRGFRRRYGMMAGAGLICLLLLLLSRFVLVLEVEGNVTLSRQQVVDALADHGFGVGSYGPGVNVRELSNSVLHDVEELSFLTVNITGIRARVIVREREPVPELLDRSRPADVAAERDGVVLSVDVLGGVAAVEPGQAVLRGEVLISGTFLARRGDDPQAVYGISQTMARGEVWALTRRTLQGVLPLDCLLPGEAEGWETGWELTFWGRSLNFYGNGSNPDTGCDKMVILYPVSLPGGTELPLGLRRFLRRDWHPGRTGAGSGERFLKAQLTRRLEAALGEGRVLELDWRVEQHADRIQIALEAQCVEEIGATVFLS